MSNIMEQLINEEKIEAAKDFIRYITDNDTPYTKAVQASSYWPVRDMNNIYENDTLMMEYSLFTPYMEDYYQITPDWAKARTAWWQMLQKIGKGEDISEALKSDVKAMAKYTSKMLGYMEKGETVFYTRHIPMEFMGTFNSHDMLMYFCITCKRLMKRYVVNPHLIVRMDIEMHRRKPVKTKVKAEAKDESDPYDIGLLDEVA